MANERVILSQRSTSKAGHAEEAELPGEVSHHQHRRGPNPGSCFKHGAKRLKRPSTTSLEGVLEGVFVRLKPTRYLDQ